MNYSKPNDRVLNTTIAIYIVIWLCFLFVLRRGIFFLPDQFKKINPGIEVDSFKVTENIPKLISVRKHRREITVSNSYTLNIDDKLLSFTFDTCSIGNGVSTYTFALSEFGSFEDFDAPNTLNISLPEGKYQLFIRKVQKNEKITSKPFVIDIDMLLSPIREVWFYPLLFSVMLFPIFLFWFSYRLLEDKKKLEANLLLEMERNRITADLHDDIGSSLSSMQINSTIAQILMESNTEKAKGIMQKIENQSKDVSEKLGDYIWSMKARKDEFMSLSTRIKSFVNTILGDTDINFSLDLDPKIDLAVENVITKKNLLFIIKEIVNNAAKYSKASHFTLSMKINQNQIILDLADDGIGFFPNLIKGNGITNIKKRVTEVSGQIQIISSTNKGCSFHIVIPLSL